MWIFSVLNVFIVCIHNTTVFKLIPLLCTHVYSYMFSTMHPPRCGLKYETRGPLNLILGILIIDIEGFWIKLKKLFWITGSTTCRMLQTVCVTFIKDLRKPFHFPHPCCMRGDQQFEHNNCTPQPKLHLWTKRRNHQRNCPFLLFMTTSKIKCSSYKKKNCLWVEPPRPTCCETHLTTILPAINWVHNIIQSPHPVEWGRGYVGICERIILWDFRMLQIHSEVKFSSLVVGLAAGFLSRGPPSLVLETTLKMIFSVWYIKYH
jgi:hypothetical protein